MHKQIRFLIFALVLLLNIALVAAAANAEEWSQYRGPHHNGTSNEKIATDWPSPQSRTIWKVPMNAGFSAIAVGGGKAATLVTRIVEGADQEVCLTLDASTGKELWTYPLTVAKYDGGGDSGTPDNRGGDGPRSTPAVDGGRVYAYSSKMLLVCLDASTGKKIWSSDVLREHAGKNITWGNASSPVIDGNLVFVAGGGSGESLLAFDKKDGQLVWKTGNERLTHSSPVIADILGEHQVIFFTQSGLVSLRTRDGVELWRFPFKYSTSSAMSPVVAGEIVYCSAGYGVGSSACRISKADGKFVATEMWYQPANMINNHWSTPIYHAGYLYGMFGEKKYGKGPLQCVEIATGKVIWSKPGFGPGGVTLVDGNLLALSDAGDLVLVEATPKQYLEKARSHILDGKCWNSAGLSQGLVYARSTKEGTCVSLRP